MNGINIRNCDSRGRYAAGIPNGPATGQWQIFFKEQNKAAFESPSNIDGRDMVAALLHTLTDSCDGLCRT